MQELSPERHTANVLRDRGIAAHRAGDRARARELLLEAVRVDPVNEYAWLWLGAAVTTNAERQYCLGRVLAINPQNDAARKALQRIRPAAPVEPKPAAPETIVEQPAVEPPGTGPAAAPSPPPTRQTEGRSTPATTAEQPAQQVKAQDTAAREPQEQRTQPPSELQRRLLLQQEQRQAEQRPQRREQRQRPMPHDPDAHRIPRPRPNGPKLQATLADALLALIGSTLTVSTVFFIYQAAAATALTWLASTSLAAVGGALLLVLQAGIFSWREQRQLQRMKDVVKAREQAFFTTVERRISSLLAEEVG